MTNNLFLNICFFYLILVCSCSAQNTHINFSVYRALSSSLSQSNLQIEWQVKNLQESFNREVSDPRTSYHAIQWQPKALLIKRISDTMFRYIDELKMSLKKEANIKMSDNREYWEEKDFNAANNLFKINGKGEELKQRILYYESNVLAVDQKMDSIFKPRVNKIILVEDDSSTNHYSFTDTFFDNIPAIAALAVLQKFENDIRNLEVQLITYCYLQIPH